MTPASTPPRALILGCGYTGLRLARALVDRGFEVIGTTRNSERFAEIRATGAEPALAEVLEPDTLRPLADARPDVVFDLVRPQRVGADQFTVEGTRGIADAWAGHRPDAIVYLSSTSVYGRREGEWTDEDSPVDPSSPFGVARLQAEQIYREAHRTAALPVRICRTPGIYGPGRTLRSRLERGAYTRVDDDSLWVSRIHVDDLVAGLIAAAERGTDGRVYLLCDDEPTTGLEYAEITAELLELPLPPAVAREQLRQELSSSAFERRVGARRCSNARMRKELGVTPRYPSVRVGVPAALREEGAI